MQTLSSADPVQKIKKDDKECKILNFSIKKVSAPRNFILGKNMHLTFKYQNKSFTEYVFFLYDVQPHQGSALWTHPWGVNHGYTTPPTKTVY